MVVGLGVRVGVKVWCVGIRYVYTTYTLRIHYVYATYTLRIHYVYATYRLRTHYVYTTYTLRIGYVHTTYTLRIRYVYMVCVFYGGWCFVCGFRKCGIWFVEYIVCNRRVVLEMRCIVVRLVHDILVGSVSYRVRVCDI